MNHQHHHRQLQLQRKQTTQQQLQPQQNHLLPAAAHGELRRQAEHNGTTQQVVERVLHPSICRHISMIASSIVV